MDPVPEFPSRVLLSEAAPPQIRLFQDPPVRGRDGLALLFLTALADLCLYRQGGGAGAGALLFAAVAALLLLSRVPPRVSTHLLLGAMGLVALMVVWNPSGLLGFTAVAGVLALAVKLHHPEWSVTELMAAIPGAVLRGPLRLAEFGATFLQRVGSSNTEPAGRAARLAVRVVAVPLLVTFMFLLIFIAANPVVERAWERGKDWLGDSFGPFFDNLSFGRAMSWVGWLLVFAALIRPIFNALGSEWIYRQEEAQVAPKAGEAGNGYASALVTLVCVNVLFLAFNALDSVYLYFKADLPSGISWAQYAHQGCFWLTVALAMSTMVIGMIFRPSLAFHARSRALRIGAYAWGAQNAVLAAGSVRRLQMYIDYNGLTYLRVVGLMGTLLVLAGLGIMLLKVARGRNFLWIVRRDLLAAWVALVVLAVAPVDYLCARYNAAVVMGGNPRPLALLTVQRLSSESDPPLLALLDHKDAWVREGVAAYLAGRLQNLERRAPRAWTEWQGSGAWSRARIRAALPRIESLVPPARWSAVEGDFFNRVRPWTHSRVPIGYDD